jgi:hypothetical protein
MSSGGSQKTAYKHIFIELPERDAVAYFEQKFGRDPEHVTCDCCGGDFSISTSPSLEQATAYHRNCDHDRKTGQYVESARFADTPLISLDQFCALPDVLVIYR